MRFCRVIALVMFVLGFAPGAWAQVRATAQPGEGIYGLLRRSGITPNSVSVAAFRQVNADALGSSDRLVVGTRYVLPSIGGSTASRAPTTSHAARTTRMPLAMSIVSVRSKGGSGAPVTPAAPETPRRTLDVPLFGSALRQVAILDHTLAGHVYYIVSGHGGPDPGTVDTYRGQRIAEDEIAYDTALRLARELMSVGATVHVIVQDPDDGIRDDEVLPVDHDEEYLGGEVISRDQNTRLDDRTRIINELYDRHRATARSQRLVSIHVDARGGKIEPQLDVHFLYATPSGKAFGTRLRQTIADQYAANQPDRVYRGSVAQRKGLKILKDTKPVAVLVELGNIGHPGDQHRLVKPGNRQALAEWLAKGLVREARDVRGT